MEKKYCKKTMELCGRTLTIETGRMARQASGAVFMKYGETTILVTASVSKEVREGTNFFPLTVDYVEQMYSSGKIPGGFFKREGKPSTEATLNARLIDRAIRPLFPDGFRYGVHVVVTVLSYDGLNDPSCLGILGASTALSISQLPFKEPIAAVRVGMVDDEILVNPTMDKIDDSQLELDVAGSEKSIVMIEAGADEVSEEVMMKAIYQGHDTIKTLVDFQKQFIDEAALPEMEYEVETYDEDILAQIEKDFSKKISEAVRVTGKLERDEALDNVKKEMLETYLEKDGEELFAENESKYKTALDELVKRSIRHAILNDHHRVDGRGLDDVRAISCEIDVLPRVHGSALFTRGETQSLGTVTLGTSKDEQIIDGLALEYRKQFYLHYNFPPFSVGEAGFMRAPGRRELGHGALAERALIRLIPEIEDFPYTIRIVSDILESNGSSSMATVCSATLALMAAGVPLSKPVAGIANGLIMEDDNFAVLTDIMGMEDHLGDMDFKVAGTKDGITALQMDIKIDGITQEIMKIALDKAKKARFFVLDKITETIDKPRTELATTAPRIETMKVDTDKIGGIIGPGGKMIKQIIEDTGVDIDIKDDGTVTIASPDKASIDSAKEYISNIVNDPEMDKIYEGKITRVEPFGAIVKIMSGTKEGLIHISQMSHAHVNKVEDLVSTGDSVKVKFIGEDRGKLRFSMKGIEGNPQPPEGSDSRPRGDRDRRHQDRRSDSRNDSRRRDDRNRDKRR